LSNASHSILLHLHLATAAKFRAHVYRQKTRICGPLYSTSSTLAILV